MRLKKQNNKRIIIISIIAIVVVLALVACGVLIYINSQKAPEMKPDDIIGIEISSRPSLTEYFVGEQFKPEGARVQVMTHDYEKSYFVDHTALSFSGFDGSKLGEQVITVTYKGFTTTFTITVKEILQNDENYIVIADDDSLIMIPKNISEFITSSNGNTVYLNGIEGIYDENYVSLLKL